MRHARLLLLPLLALLAACGAQAPATCGIRPYAEVPVRVVQGAPLVAASINGAPVTLLLDTGAERTVLTEEAARRVGLSFDARRVVRGSGAGGMVASFAAQVQRFEFAGLDIPDHAVVASATPLPVAVGERVDGLLPALVLSAFDVDLDLAQGRMTLYGGTVCGDTAIPPWKEPAVSVPAEVSRGARMNALVTVGTTPATALLDTGASRTFISQRAALAGGVTPEQLAAAPTSEVRGIGPQVVSARRVPIPLLQVGPETFRNIPLMVMDSGLEAVDMILGMDYLGSRRFWFSYARRQVFIMAQPRR